MSYFTGFARRKIESSDEALFLSLCANTKNEGYELHKSDARIDWPFFWRKVYTAQFRKYYIIDDSKIAYFSKREIERIKTGK